MGYAGDGSVGSAASRWSSEQLDYLLYLYKLVRVALKVLGEQRVFFTGSLAMNAHFEPHERRMVGGVDLVVLGDEWGGENQGGQLCGKINLELEKQNLVSDLKLNGTTIRLGFFEALKGAGQERLRLVALVRGGNMTLKKSCRLVPSGGSKLAYLDGDRNVSELHVSPVFLDIRRTHQQCVLVNKTCTNDAAQLAGYEPIPIRTPPIEQLVAAKLNMIYQSSINENIIRATPLAAHYAAKGGRQRVSPVDIYDFVLGAKQANPLMVKRALKPMLVEPVNAVLDMTTVALNRIGAGKHHEELNSLLPADRALTQEGWRSLCAEAAEKIRRIREA